MKDVLELMAIVLFVLLDIAMNIALIFVAIVILYYTWPILLVGGVAFFLWIKCTSKSW